MAVSLGEAAGEALGAGGSAGSAGGAAAVVGPVGPVGPVVPDATGGAGTPVVVVVIGAASGAGLDFLSHFPRARASIAASSASGKSGAYCSMSGGTWSRARWSWAVVCLHGSM